MAEFTFRVLRELLGTKSRRRRLKRFSKQSSFDFFLLTHPPSLLERHMQGLAANLTLRDALLLHALH